MLQGLAWVPGTLALFLVVPWLVRDHPLGRAVWGVVAGAALIVVFVVCQAVGRRGAFTALRRRPWSSSAWSPRQPSSGATGADRSPSATGSAGWPSAPPCSPCRSCRWRCRAGLVAIPVWVTPVLHLASQAVYPAAVLVAVLRGRMWGLQLAVSRTVLAGLMTVTLTATYVVVTWLVTRVVPGLGVRASSSVRPPSRWPCSRPGCGSSGGCTGSCTAPRPTPDHVVRRLGSHLSVEGSAEALLRGLAEDVGTAMRLESVDPGRARCRRRRLGGAVRVAGRSSPLRHRGEEVGAMVGHPPRGRVARRGRAAHPRATSPTSSPPRSR